MKKNILITGGTGLIGQQFIRFSKNHKTIISPSHKECDITDKDILENFLFKQKPEFIINFAAHTNIAEAEKEKGNKKGITWMTNFQGVKNLADYCRKKNIFLIQISTDAVFPGTKRNPGPYDEDNEPSRNKNEVNWYGFTKIKAEEEIKKLKKNYAIIRISHPFGNPKSQRDLVSKTIRDINKGVGIFVDQLFTPAFIDDLTLSIWAIINKRKSGIFHVGCQGLVSRFEFDQYLVKKLKIKKKIIPSSMEEFLKHNAPHTRLGGFMTAKTQDLLGVKFHNWQEALDKTILRI